MRKISEGAQIRAGVILSYAIEAINIISGLIYTPMMLSLLGQSEYGLYQLVFSTVSYLSLIGLGFSSSYQRYYAKAKVQNEQEVAKLNGMFMIVFCVMSAVCLICGALMIQRPDLIFGNKLTSAELTKSKILLTFMIFNMALTFPNSLFTSNITAHKQFIFQRLVILAERLVNPFICIPLLFMGYGSIGLVVISTVLAVTAFLCNSIFCIQKLKMKFSFRGLRFSKLKELWGFTFFIFLNQIVNQVNWNVAKFLLGRFYGTAVVAIYSVGGQLRGYFSQFSTSISNVYIPQVNQIVAKTDDNKELDKLFIKVGTTQAYVIFLVVSGFAIFGKMFIHLWAGREYNQSFYIALMLFLVLVIPYIQNLGVEIQRAKNKHRVRSVVYLIMAGVNVVISIPLIKNFGAIGAAIGTTISIFLCNVVFMNIYYSKYIGLDIIRFWKNILKLVPGVLPPILFGILYNILFKQENWFILALGIASYTTVYCASMFFLTINKNQRKQIISRFKQKIKKYNTHGG